MKRRRAAESKKGKGRPALYSPLPPFFDRFPKAAAAFRLSEDGGREAIFVRTKPISRVSRRAAPIGRLRRRCLRSLPSSSPSPPPPPPPSNSRSPFEVRSLPRRTRRARRRVTRAGRPAGRAIGLEKGRLGQLRSLASPRGQAGKSRKEEEREREEDTELERERELGRLAARQVEDGELDAACFQEGERERDRFGLE